MTIAMILAEKGREVITTHEGATLREAAGSLMRNGIGALVILDATNALIGLIAERDIVAAVATDGADALDRPVTDYMQAGCAPAHDNDTVYEVMQIMTMERRRHIPVMREGHLSGLVSIGDVVKHRLRVVEDEHRSMREYIAQA